MSEERGLVLRGTISTPWGEPPLAERIALMRPQFLRVNADVADGSLLFGS